MDTICRLCFQTATVSSSIQAVPSSPSDPPTHSVTNSCAVFLLFFFVLKCVRVCVLVFVDVRFSLRTQQAESGEQFSMLCI